MKWNINYASIKNEMENTVKKGLSNRIGQISDLEDKTQEIYQKLEQKYTEMEIQRRVKGQKRSIQEGPKHQLNRNSRVREQRHRKEGNNEGNISPR